MMKLNFKVKPNGHRQYYSTLATSCSRSRNKYNEARNVYRNTHLDGDKNNVREFGKKYKKL